MLNIQDPTCTPAARRPTTSLIGQIVVWLSCVALGLAALFLYSVNAGTAGEAPRSWPTHTRVPWVDGAPQLVMVAHPRCSCTRASIAELSRLMTRLNGKLRAHVLFLRPNGKGADWERTDLYESAALITGVTVHTDVGGDEVRRFGAATSGQVYLYGTNRRLVFSGGITPSRSHQGDNVGRRRIVELVTLGETERDSSTVYGCPLSERELPSPWISWLTAP